MDGARHAPELVIRPWRAADAAAIDRAIAESREHLLPFMAWAAPPPMTTVARRAWLREQAAAGDRLYGGWAPGAVVAGAAGLHDRIGPGGLEIGYWVHVAHLRRGVATALARAMVERASAVPGVGHVEIHHDAANVASGRVAQRLGFTLVGDHREPPLAPAESGVHRVWRLELER